MDPQNKKYSVTTLAAQPHPGPCSLAPSSQAEITAPAGPRATPQVFLLSPLLCPGHRGKTRGPQEVDKPRSGGGAIFLSELSLLLGGPGLGESSKGLQAVGCVRGRGGGASRLNLSRGGSETHPDLLHRAQRVSRGFTCPASPCSPVSRQGPTPSPAHSQSLPNWTPVQAPAQSDDVLT